jgi:hypothetical protein
MLSSVSSRPSQNISQLIHRMQAQLASVQAQLKPQPPSSLSGLGSTPAQSPVSPAASQPQSDFARRYYSDSFEPAAARPSGAGAPGAGASDPDAVANQIAQRAAGWNYDHSGGKTWGQTLSNEGTFDGSKSGVCTDMALEAAQQFKDAGVNARVVFGQTDRGNHAWVEYQDKNGEWKAFDPTAAACTKDPASAITPMDNGLYGYGRTITEYTAPIEQ